MRILHCLRAPVGGLFRHVLDLSSAQADLGHDVGILADTVTGDRLTEAKFAAVAPRLKLGIERTPMSRWPGVGDLAAARAVRDHAKKLGVEVVHGHGAKGGAFSRLAARSLNEHANRVASFYTPHGGSLHYPPFTLAGQAFIRIERILDRYTDGIVFESAYAARLYGERMGKGRAEHRVIPNGLQPADFVEVAPDPDAAEFLFVGELRDLKGVDVLLHALRLVNEHRAANPARAVIVGCGPDAERFKALAVELGLATVTRFPGAMPAREAFKLGRVILVPSRAESFVIRSCNN